MLSLRICAKLTHLHAMFHRLLLDIPDFSSLLSLLTATSTSTVPTGIRLTTCASPLEVMQSGYLANSSPPSHLPLFTSATTLSSSSPIFPQTSQTPKILSEYDEHSGPDERSHCDDLRQSFMQTVTPTLPSFCSTPPRP